jgi:hypothetical protein
VSGFVPTNPLLGDGYEGGSLFGWTTVSPGW